MASTGRVPFLFDPAAVRTTVAAFPSLARELNPDLEGVEAAWFQQIRKSERQLYRVLGNTHYKHLVDLLGALDTCLQHGYKQPRLLKTRARSSFAADWGELRVAEHFAIAGCEIAGLRRVEGRRLGAGSACDARRLQRRRRGLLPAGLRTPRMLPR